MYIYQSDMPGEGVEQERNGQNRLQPWGAWLAQLVEYATLDLWAVSSSPTLCVQLTFKKKLKLKKNRLIYQECFMICQDNQCKMLLMYITVMFRNSSFPLIFLHSSPVIKNIFESLYINVIFMYYFANFFTQIQIYYILFKCYIGKNHVNVIVYLTL